MEVCKKLWFPGNRCISLSMVGCRCSGRDVQALRHDLIQAEAMSMVGDCIQWGSHCEACKLFKLCKRGSRNKETGTRKQEMARNQGD